MDELTFLKLGGSALTDKTRAETLNVDVLDRVVAVIAAHLRANPHGRLLIAHGGGSYGHHWAHTYQTHRGVVDDRGWEGVARVADAMSRLNRDVVSRLLVAGINAISIQPSASALARQGTLESMATDVLAEYLRAGMTPVLYGDVVFDREQGAAIISTEALFSYLAPLLHPRRVILAGETAVFTADPRREPAARHIPRIDELNIQEVLLQTGGSHGVDVTGGMASKVALMWQLVSSIDGLEVVLVGVEEGPLSSALAGRWEGLMTRMRRSPISET